MAVRSPITRDDEWFTNEAKTVSFEVLDADPEENAAAAPVDVSAFAMSWKLIDWNEQTDRNRSKKTAAELLSRATGGGGITVTGAFNATRSLNTQRVEVAVTAALTQDIEGDRERWHELRRTDGGAEAVLAYGPAYLCQSAT